MLLHDWLAALGMILAAYLLGSIPTGYWVGRLRGVDIRTLGSGNIGASNIQRTLGTRVGIGVLAVDVGKGFIAAFFLARLIAFPQPDVLRVLCGAAAIGGHTFTIFLKFKGGKGVATTYGVMLGLAPLATVAVFLAFVAVVALTRYISAGSVVSAGLFPVGVWVFGESGKFGAVLLLALCIGTVIVFRHRTNIGRIMRGEENRLGKRIDFETKAGKS